MIALFLLCAASAGAWAQPEPKRILILYSYRNTLPINSEFITGIREGLALPLNVPVEIDSEDLDLSRVSDEEYVRKLVEIYELKYSANPPDLVISAYKPAAEFLLNHRHELFPGIPFIFCSAAFSSDDLERLPPDITGVTLKRDVVGTAELMSRLHPGMRHIAVVVGSGTLDQAAEREARSELKPFESSFDFTWLRGLPLPELTKAVKTLPPNTAILYLIQLSDREGALYVPRKVVQEIANAANAPVYGLWDTLMDSGIVGGRLISIYQHTVAAGKIARRILMGEAPSSISVVRMEQNPVIVDARQLQRWNIDEGLLPEGSQVLYREPSLWDQHHEAILIAGAVMALQALWIAALMRSRRQLQGAQTALSEEYEHRMQAEGVTRRLRARLVAHEKQSTLGALAARIAHEISQPLISIKNFTQAAKRYVPANSVNEAKLNELLADVEGEAERAGSIIRKIRTLLSSEGVDAVSIALDGVLREVIDVMGPEADILGCRIDYRFSAPVPNVLADALQVQLVMVNLLRNAMEATAVRHENGYRAVSITVNGTADRMVQVNVADNGPGVPAEEIGNIFESLYTTKETGMGVGLATCKAIVEAHGGRIGCSPNPAGGAIFHFTLPAAATGDKA